MTALAAGADIGLDCTVLPKGLIASFGRIHTERGWRPEAGLRAMVADAWQAALGKPR